MKIALVGYGKMGQSIEKMATSRGHIIVSRITSKNEDLKSLEESDLAMEFTHPSNVSENIQKLLPFKKDIVIGTTGWDINQEALDQLARKHQVGILYSPNFSLGIQILLSIVDHASKLINSFEDYDVAGVEYHHHTKKDAPSGTARAIADTIEKNTQRSQSFSFSSVRCGSIPGTHTLLFDSPCDTITISHEARNRDGFAKGAVQAAEWLHGKKGFFTFRECFQDIIQGKFS